MTRCLRPEARPLSWSVLSEAQKGAFRKIVALIGDALPPRSREDEGSAGVRRSVDEWLSDDRSSRTVFLDGGRGSGKTTILLSLMQACSSKGEQHIAEAPGKLRDDLHRIRDHLVWLQPIDMEPAPESFHFLGAILARLEQVVGYVGLESRAAASDEPAGLLDPNPSYYSALTKLRRLQTSVALAWDGNVHERGPRVDPDTFAQEMMRTEKSRLSLSREVQRVLDELARTVMRSSEVRDPLFVLPIDDFDLNPPACLLMLRMLRMISVPRLFTVLLGDLRVARVVLNLKLSSDIAGVGRGVHVNQVSVEPSEVARCAGEVADNALRKLAPPSQCIQLGRYDMPGGLQFRPIGSAEQDPQLHQLLAAIPMAFADANVTGVGTCDLFRGYSLKSYLNFLVAPALYARGFERPETFDPNTPPDDVYQGAQLVESSPRRLADLWLSLSNIVPKPLGVREQDDPSSAETVPDQRLRADMVEHFGRECRRLLKSEPALNPTERETVPPANTNGGMAIGDWDIANLPVRLTAVTSRYANVDTTPPGQSLYEAQVALLHARHWQLRVLESQPGETATPRVLLPETTALYVVVYDLLALSPGRHQPRPPRLENLLAQNTSWAATEWSVGGAQTVTLRWPIPPLASVWGFDQFTAAWNKHLSSTSTVSPEESFFTWLSLGSAVLAGEEPVECERGAPTKGDWQALSLLLKRCVELTPRARDWAIKAVSLLMPEFALPPSAVKSLGETDVIKQFAGKYRPLIRRARLANLGLLWEGGFADLVHDLRKEFGGINSGLGIGEQFFKTPANRTYLLDLEAEEVAEAAAPATRQRTTRRKRISA